MREFFRSNLSRKLLGLLTVAVLLLVIARGVMDPLLCFDPWQYHVSFAAWLWNIGNARELVGSIGDSPRFNGFGLTANWWQGFFWWLFGSVNFIPLANIFPFILLILAAWCWFLVSPVFLSFTLLAMPLVAIHATSGYIDLFVGACEMIAILAAIRLMVLLDRPGQRKQILSACVVLAFGALMAANAKHSAVIPVVMILALAFIKIHQLKRFLFNVPISLLGLALVVWLCLLSNFTHAQTMYAVASYICVHLLLVMIGVFRQPRLQRRLLLLILLIMVGSGATMIKNVVVHHNPVHPLKNPLYEYGLTFGQPKWSHRYAEQSHFFKYSAVQGAKDFLMSLVEYNMFFERPKWFFYAEASQNASQRQGGFYGLLIIGLTLFLTLSAGYLCWKKRLGPELIHALQFLCLLTVVYMFTIQSYELRYCFAWAMCLCFVCGLLINRLWMNSSLLGVVKWLVIALFVFSQTALPLQRRLYDLKWVSYYPADIIKKLDPKTLEDFRHTGLGCSPRTEILFKYDGFGTACEPSLLVYSPIFTLQNYKFFWVTKENECDELIQY